MCRGAGARCSGRSQSGESAAAASVASHYALGADGVGLRARAPAAAGSLPRATRSAPKAWALRARAPTFAPPPLTCAR